MNPAPWNPDLYLRFAEHRTQAAFDLVNRITLPAPRRVIDIGCGPGNSTALLRQRWPNAEVIGLDNSPEMIAAAAKSFPTGTWISADVRDWSMSAAAPSTCFDVIFSNAVLQWIPDHGGLLPRLLQMVASDGALAVQIPHHVASPVHRLMLEISQRQEWHDRMEAARSALTMEEPVFYYDLLSNATTRFDLWETEYQHVMTSPAAILDWIRGTGLRPFLQALSNDAERSQFEQFLLAGLEQAYPRRADGKVLFPFRRLFFVAYR